ncbi:MAG: CDP-glycerol glycerophosphotransferase family protein [Candidatus Dojkabacteria bacterium]|nr:CDP-glycerol glycerophosphotransferase family protein [Candidatus Dojkabacteria bacterium]
MKLLPTQNKVSFHSRLVENEEPLDFRLVREEIERRDPNCKTVLLAKRIPKSLIGKIGYVFYLLKRMYHIATSRACVIDSYIIPISILNHKKDLIVIQIPHGMGAIKKVGYQVLDKEEGSSEVVAEEMKMHRNYDYVIANGPEAGQWYVEGYRIDPKTINLAGMPRIDYLRDSKDKIDPKVKEMCPTLDSKKTIVYIPTFRIGKGVETEDLINAVDYDKYNLIITCHPNNRIVSDNPNVIISTDEDVLYHEWIKVCDYFITDYSSVVFEAILLDKPVFLYVYDFDEYKEKRGLNLDWFKEIPQYTSRDPKEIIKMIEKDKYNLSDLDSIKDRYLSARDNQCTKEIVDLIYKN